MTKLDEVAQLGQAIWLDYIRRAFIESGELRDLIDAGLRGVTSNPSIFEKAITGSADYDKALQALVEAGKTVDEMYEALVIDDIQRAADLLRRVYDESGGVDGYVSLEVNPALAEDTEATIAEARRLYDAVNRPNVMIKVPATPAGIPAIKRLTGQGVNVNVTLIFSLESYEQVAEAYIAGLEEFFASHSSWPTVPTSVASFFVSRVDSAVDKLLEEKGQAELKAKAGIANAKMAYNRFRQIFNGRRWQELAARGARLQRPLWASTSTKNPAYPDTMYVDALIGPDTVNTLPPATLNAFQDHGVVSFTLAEGMDQAHQHLDGLASLGIDMAAVTQQLLDEGVAAFARSFHSLMAGISEKCEQLQSGWQTMYTSLGQYQPAVDKALADLKAGKVMERIWAHDHTVWRPEPTEISNRLGWLQAPEMMVAHLQRLQALAEDLHGEGYRYALLLGMGGSSLAPEVFYKTFGMPAGSSNPFLELIVLDSTDPDMIDASRVRLDLSRTLVIVATKSGGTVETLSGFKYFYNQMIETVGEDEAGQHFIAITDPGSSLIEVANRYHFRQVFLNDPNIGGRYSVLSYFGLVPAALVGVDLSLLLERAGSMMVNAHGCNCPIDGDNLSARLGAILGALARAGRDKVTFIAAPAVASFGDWVEQLIAESTGKEGKGILPVVGEFLGPPEAYGDDRLFVHLHLEGDKTGETELMALEKAGHPTIVLCLRDLYDLGGQFFLWQMATAVAGHIIDIQPFDQPNVEAAKVLARRMVEEYRQTGELPQGDFAALNAETLHSFLAQAQPGDYIALQAYVHPTAAVDEALQQLRTQLRNRYMLATTLGYGPRFLHSTGQLHKGDGGNGLFIQFTSDPIKDIPIPDEAGRPQSTMTFGILKAAQALGDAQALRDAGRRVISYHLGQDVAGNLRQFTS